jgi:hypothetical protein
MMIKKTVTFFFLLLFLSSTGCAYRHYLGMHGPSINSNPEIHAMYKMTLNASIAMTHGHHQMLHRQTILTLKDVSNATMMPLKVVCITSLSKLIAAVSRILIKYFH